MPIGLVSTTLAHVASDIKMCGGRYWAFPRALMMALHFPTLFSPARAGASFAATSPRSTEERLKHFVGRDSRSDRFAELFDGCSSLAFMTSALSSSPEASSFSASNLARLSFSASNKKSALSPSSSSCIAPHPPLLRRHLIYPSAPVWRLTHPSCLARWSALLCHFQHGVSSSSPSPSGPFRHGNVAGGLCLCVFWGDVGQCE